MPPRPNRVEATPGLPKDQGMAFEDLPTLQVPCQTSASLAAVAGEAACA